MAWPSEILNRVFNAAARALNVKIVDGAGAEKFTDMNPGSMQLTGSYMSEATPFTLTQDSTANTAQTLSIAGVPGRSHYITFFEVVLSGAACTTECSVIIRDGTENILKEIIGVNSLRGTRVGATLFCPIVGSVGETVSITVSEAGADAITTINVGGYTI